MWVRHAPAYGPKPIRPMTILARPLQRLPMRLTIMAGLIPVIHALLAERKTLGRFPTLHCRSYGANPKLFIVTNEIGLPVVRICSFGAL
jgi:hypothetical protein